VVLHDYALYKSTFTLLYFTLLYFTYQTDIHTVKFIQKFQSSDYHICNLFSKRAEIGVNLTIWESDPQCL